MPIPLRRAPSPWQPSGSQVVAKGPPGAALLRRPSPLPVGLRRPPRLAEVPEQGLPARSQIVLRAAGLNLR
jgi:hypothetical protein